MMIHRNIKSRIKSRTLRSLPERSRKRHLSFYSSIERDIRDIEMRLYRIKKALRYYSEENDNKKEDDLNKSLEIILDETEKIFLDGLSENRTNSKSIKYGDRVYYSEAKIERQLERLIREEFKEPLPEIDENNKGEKTYSTAKSLLKRVLNKIDNIKKKINSVAEKFSYAISATLSITSGVLLGVSHEQLSKLGEIGYLDYAINHPEVIVRVFTIIALIFGAIISFLVGLGYREKAKNEFNSVINEVKNKLKQAASKFLLSGDEESLQLFETKVKEIEELIDTHRNKSVTLEQFKEMLYPKLEELQSGIA